VASVAIGGCTGIESLMGIIDIATLNNMILRSRFSSVIDNMPHEASQSLNDARLKNSRIFSLLAVTVVHACYLPKFCVIFIWTP